MKILNTIFCLALLAQVAFAQTTQKEIRLAGNQNLQLVGVAATHETFRGKPSLKVTDRDRSGSEATFVKLSELDFKDGTIQLELAGQPGTGASDQARGFVGVAFRVAEDNSKFECFYLRPTNGRAEDQVRRNHSTQYISFPEFPWHTLRKEFPEKYESYADLVPGEWTRVKIEVNGSVARLFVHGHDQPALIVNDLKHGPDAHGAIGLWIGPGTEAHFTDLVVSTR